MKVAIARVQCNCCMDFNEVLLRHGAEEVRRIIDEAVKDQDAEVKILDGNPGIRNPA